MLSNQIRSLLLIVALVLFIPVGVLQYKIDPFRKRYEPVNVDATTGAVNSQVAANLPFQFALPAIVGFKEVIAGLLWVEADEFFDDGDYAAIIPIIRLICWLDPHQVDVYETGAWHMDYNFTDAENRSDRRYIPFSLALMREGIANNPNVPDMYGDMAFTHYYKKIGDYANAATYFSQGQAALERVDKLAKANPGNQQLQDSEIAADSTVTTVCHGLAHALEAEGLIPQAEAQWEYCIARHQADASLTPKTRGPALMSLFSARKNLYELQERAKYRPIDTKVPIDMHFQAEIVRVAPKIFEIRGTLNAIGAKSFDFDNHHVDWGPVDGCRVEIRLTDQGYTNPNVSFGLFHNVLGTATILQDSVSVRNGHFERKFDLSQDPDIYSFSAQKYTVTIWFNPASPNDTPPNVQDRIGWLGEGLDKHQQFYDDSGLVPGIDAPIKGLQMLKETFTVTRDDLVNQSNPQTTFN